jgi:hypothetical protein
VKLLAGPTEPLFLACRFFDRECAGYIEAEDLEEILFMISDCISSAPSDLPESTQNPELERGVEQSVS